MYTDNRVDNENVEELVRLIKPDYVPPSIEYEAVELFFLENRRFGKLFGTRN